MLRTFQLSTTGKLEPDDFHKAMATMHDHDYSAAITKSKRTFADLAGVDPSLVIHRIEKDPPYYDPYGRPAVGDIFFREDGIFYCLIQNDEARVIHGPEGAIIHQRMLDGERTMEVGLVTNLPEGAEDRLRSFAEVFKDAICNTVDGRKTRHLKFDWQPVRNDSRLTRFLADGKEEAENRFEYASIEQPSLVGASALATPAARELLQELSRAGFARERDIMNRKRRGGDNTEDVLESLNKAGLLAEEHLIECKTQGTPLTRLATHELAYSDPLKEMRCPSCGRSFADENICRVYAVSPLGRSLIQKSHWMTVWVTNQMINLGVPKENMLWNLSESGEEIDMVASVFDALWIFELKDREFGAGDAYPFNYRKARYGADRAIIITTEKVSKDAKRVFDDFAEETRRGTRRWRASSELAPGAGAAKPVYVEGLDNFESLVGSEISSQAFRFAARRLRPLEMATGYNLTRIVQARFGSTSEAGQ